MKEALVIARNFLRFRTSVSWPVELQAAQVQGPLGEWWQAAVEVWWTFYHH